MIAADKEHAEKLADRLARIAGERPEIVTSDAPDASARIARFAAGTGTLARVGADGLRGRRRPAPARRRLRHERAHGAVLPPGRRPLHPPHARRRAHQMSHLFLPSDPTLKRLAGQIEEERNHALVAKPEGEAIERGERGEPGDPFHALSSSARRDEDVLRTTAPGDALQLFAEADPGALAGAGRVRRRHHRHHDRDDPRLGTLAPRRRDRLREARAPARGAPQPRRHDRPPHRRGAPRDQRAHQPRRRRAVGRQVDRGAAREGQQLLEREAAGAASVARHGRAARVARRHGRDARHPGRRPARDPRLADPARRRRARSSSASPRGARRSPACAPTRGPR